MSLLYPADNKDPNLMLVCFGWCKNAHRSTSQDYEIDCFGQSSASSFRNYSEQSTRWDGKKIEARRKGEKLGQTVILEIDAHMEKWEKWRKRKNVGERGH